MSGPLVSTKRTQRPKRTNADCHHSKTFLKKDMDNLTNGTKPQAQTCIALIPGKEYLVPQVIGRLRCVTFLDLLPANHVIPQ